MPFIGAPPLHVPGSGRIAAASKKLASGKIVGAGSAFRFIVDEHENVAA
jgi:hypothetical protein